MTVKELIDALGRACGEFSSAEMSVTFLSDEIPSMAIAFKVKEIRQDNGFVVVVPKPMEGV